MLCLSDQKNVPSLGEFIIHSQKQYQEATGELTQIMSAIELASKVISREINKAGLVDIFGNAGSSNSHGEDQQKLDVIANEIFSSCLAARGNVCGIASEEDESFVVFPSIDNLKSKYVVVFDPVDGSSNINVGIPVGTIFSIYKRVSKIEEVPAEEDFLQAGNQQVAAGYVLYGSSTVLVYTFGEGVNAFTLDPATGEYFLSRENIKIPDVGKTYSVNDAYFEEYSSHIQSFINSMRREKSSSRYVGSLVADFHRNLIQGGIFLYPANKKKIKWQIAISL